jgi:hypothetical protein
VSWEETELGVIIGGVDIVSFSVDGKLGIVTVLRRMLVG